jgi:autotransporter-associated beta strand protein/T5SS/PEP-CTERM-associated repeat protein
MWLKARSREGFWSFRKNKTNHAMKNNSLKISSASSELKTPLDSNKENISANFQLPLTGSITMKKTFALPVIIAALAALFALSTHASANGFPTIYWLGSNGTTWTAGDNWSSTSNGTTPTSFSANNYIVFSATGSSNETATNLGGDQTISSLTINATGPVGISGGNLTIDGTTTQAITVEAGNLTISSPLILTGSATTITANQSTSIASIEAANGLVFDGTSSASIGAITANDSLQKQGSGTTTLTGNNTYTGNTTISEGTLALTQNGNLGNSTIRISGGMLDMGGKSLTNTLGTLTGGELANGTLTNNGSRFNLQNGTVSATLAGTNGVNKTTSGTVILSGSNTYNGTTSINAGTLQIGNESGLGSGGNITFGGGILQYGSGITTDVSSRIKNSASSAIRIDTNGNDVTFSSSINSTNNGGLTKLGNGTLSLSANSSYTGGIFIETGTLTGSTLGLKGSITNNATLLLNSFGSYKTEISGSGKLLIGYPPFYTPVRFLGNATMTGGTTILQSGILTIGGLDSNTYIVGSISGDIANEGRLEFDLSTAAGSRTYAGIISGNGSLGTSNAGSGATGRLILTGNNTYTGGTFVSLGTVDISGGRLASTGNVTITGGNFEIGASNQVIGDFQISGTQITSATGTGTLTATLYDLQQGTVSISLAGTAGIEKNSVGAGASSYDNGVAFLSGNNTSNGTISVSSGILSFNTVQSLYSGNNSSWTKENISVGAGSTTPFIATLALATGNGSATSGFNNEQIAEIFSNLTQNGTGGLTANSSIGFNVASGNFTLNSTISDRPYGGSIGMEKIGAGVLVLGTQNSFSGPLNIYEGTVRAGTNNALSNSTSLVITTKMGERPSIYDVGNFNQQFVNVTLLSGTLAGGTGTINATGNYTLWSGNATANLSGEAGLTKEGSENEIVYLSGTNSYTGHTTTNGTYWNGYFVDAPTVSDARLQFQKPAALYSGNNATWNTGNITVNSYGILSVQAGDGVQGFTSNQIGTLITNLVTADRTTGGFLNGSALGIDTAGVNITLETPLTDSGITGGGSVGLVKYGTGTLTLNGNNTHSLVTSVTGGGLVVANGAQLSASTAGLSIQNATVDLGTNSQSVGSVYVSNGSILGSGTLTSTAGQFYFVGANVTPNLAGSVNATITSPGTTTLSGNNSYSGRTYLSASATLILANANALAGSTLSTYSNGSPVQLSAPGTNTYNFGGLEGSLNLNFGANSLSIGANNEDTSFGSSTGILSGSGTVTKVGNGTLTLLGNNTYSGGTTISAGTLALGNGGTSGSATGDITNNANLVFNRSGNSTYSDTISGTGNFTKAGSGILNLNGAQTYIGTTTISGGTLGLVGSLASTSVAISSGATLLNQNSGLSASSSIVNAGTFTINASQTVGSLSGSGNTVLNAALTTGGLGTADEISGNITGNASLTKVGSGTLSLTGSATNAGGLVISSGNVSIGNGGTTGSVTGNITNNAALAFNRSNDFTYSGIVSGSGSLEQLGTGTTILAGNNTYGGGTIVTAGTLQGTTQSLQGAITNNASLVFNQSTNGTYAGALAGTGMLSKAGTGTITFSGTSSFSGTTAINSGTLAVTGSLVNSTTQINSGATLAGTGTLGAVTINDGGTIAPGNSPGNLTVGNMTWNSGGIYAWELGNATGTAGTNWDLIKSTTGNLTINVDSGPQFTIAASTNSSSSGFDPNARYYSWKIAEFANIQGFSSDKFIINPTGFEGGLGILTLSANNTALNLNYATMATWNAGTGNWTTSSNWEDGIAPINGIAVEYAGPLGTNGTSTNDDLALANISGLTFTSGANGSFTVAGGDLELGSGGIVNNSTFTQTVGLNITLGADQTFAANTANLIVSGNITGGYSLTKEGNQTLTFAGANTYTGETTINAGTLSIAAGGSLNGTTKILVGNLTSNNALEILGSVNAGNATLSHQVGSDNNTVIVGGGSTPASLTVSNLLNVGFGGEGNSLEILGNGTVTAASTEIGGFGANNTLNLTGGVLNSTSYLVVGFYADGNALNITEGGNATAGSVTVGLDTGSANNTILVSGTGSALHTAGLIYLGENGTSNNISIENGGKVVSQNADAVIGFNAGSDGNALSINGTSSQFTNNGTLYVGKGGSENTLAIDNRASLVTRNTRIGGGATSSNNTVTVGGNGSIWTNAGTLSVGYNGTGNTLTLSDGGAVNITGDTYLGYGVSSASNLLTINGTGSSFASGNLLVGQYGSSNTLRVENGGNVTLAGALAVGYHAASSNNTVEVSGASSTLSAQNIQIGSGADNKLIVADSGLVSTANIDLAGTNATLQIGNGTSAGNLSLTGSILTSGAVTGRSVVFNHTDSAYQFGSILSGDLALSQVGTGTTTLTANNTYTGGTTISVGTLALGGTQGLVNGTIFVGAGASFSVNRTNDFTLGNIISGAGSFAHIGSNKTSITAVNNYTGGTTISSGTLWTKNSQALGTGNVLVNGGKLLTTSSQEPIMGNQTLSIGGNLDWTSGKIAFYDTGSSPLSGDLTINVAGNFTASAGNKTFDFSEVEALGYGNYTLVNATVVSAGSAIFVAAHGPYTTLFGNFTTTNNTVVYTVTGAESTGSDIQNNGGPNTPVVAVFDVTQATQTIGANNTVNALDFSNSASLTINATGQLTVTSGTLGVQTGSSVVSGGTLNTPGNFDKTGAGELDLDNTTNVNGIANVVAGLLSVNGQLNANSVMVDPTATLGGAGVIVAQNVVVNGNLSPGNSPGTLNVVGNLVLGAGSSTVIEIASPTNFDRIVVSGTATLGGTLNAVAYGGGTITPGARYDFLQAGSIDGEFASLIAPDGLRIRFLNSGTVGTLLFGPASFVPYALNQNQVNVAKALDIFVLATEGDAIVVGIALDSLTTEQFPAAFDQIMPGFYESLANIAIEQAFNQTQMLNQRISSVRLGAAGFQAIGGISQPLVHDKNGKSAADAKDASPIVESATAMNWNAWALGTGMFSRSTNLGSLQNYNNDAGGFLVGADYRWSDNFVTGLYGGYDYSYAEYNGGGSTKGNSFSFGTYASYAKDGYYADAVIGGGYTGFQTKRSIAFSTIDRTASADPNSGQFTAGLNLGKDFEVGKFTLGPIVGAQYTYAGIGGFTESGADSLDLSLGQQNANSLRSTLGGRIAYTWNLNQKIALIPEVRMFWQHEFLNNPRNINASLDGGNGASFDYETTAPYRDSVFAGAGVTAQFGKNLSGSVFYNINFGSQTYQSNMVSAGLNFSF